MALKTTHIWVVEMRSGNKWLPTVGVCFSIRQARIEKSDWEERNPDDEFRIERYIREADTWV
jgi:hypothetical protein